MKSAAILRSLCCSAAVLASFSVSNPANAHQSSWTGLYLGANAGYGWGDAALVFDNFPAFSTSDIGTGGAVGGIHVGYNYQLSSNLVVGVDVAWMKADIEGSKFAQPVERNTVTTDWLALVNGRIGYAHESVLFYVTGGAAFGAVESLHEEVGGVERIGQSRRHSGWNLGAGVEWKLMPNISLGLEYRHVDLNRDTHAGLNNVGLNVQQNNHAVQSEIDMVLGRLTFHLSK